MLTDSCYLFSFSYILTFRTYPFGETERIARATIKNSTTTAHLRHLRRRAIVQSLVTNGWHLPFIHQLYLRIATILPRPCFCVLRLGAVRRNIRQYPAISLINGRTDERSVWLGGLNGNCGGCLSDTLCGTSLVVFGLVWRPSSSLGKLVWVFGLGG